ncbi:hypothetical protein K435DRAFT_863049 [Dendrothele bispora CBS 962.96]|uniref:DOMON domain-containing protein n=1 Tax=Dendrothele bispora (strain CBS 962.96) TaxID=1314807 RepID=A0A4S8LQW8_DENBC|nr:hypothetical protein K435DRAFT_863049 [Dendrothele bispora CBS 962.96]
MATRLAVFLIFCVNAFSIAPLSPTITQFTPVTVSWFREQTDPPGNWFLEKQNAYGFNTINPSDLVLGTSEPLSVENSGGSSGTVVISFTKDPGIYRLLGFGGDIKTVAPGGSRDQTFFAGDPTLTVVPSSGTQVSFSILCWKCLLRSPGQISRASATSRSSASPGNPPGDNDSESSASPGNPPGDNDSEWHSGNIAVHHTINDFYVEHLLVRPVSQHYLTLLFTMFVAIISPRGSSTFPSKTPSASSDHPDNQNNQPDSKRLTVILASTLSITAVFTCLTLVWIFRVRRKREQAISQAHKYRNERKAKPLLPRLLKIRLNTGQKVGRGSISPFDVMRPREPLNDPDSEEPRLPPVDTQSFDQATISIETERGQTSDTGRTSVNTVIPNSRRVGNGILFPSQVYERVRASERKQRWDRASSNRMNKVFDVKTSRSGLSFQRVEGEDSIPGLDLGVPMPRNSQNRRQRNIVQHMDSGLRIQAVLQADLDPTRDLEDVQDEEEVIDLPPTYASV